MNRPGSPAPTKSEAELVKRNVKKGHDIAKRVTQYTYDYKGKTPAQLKALLQERDSELFILAEEFLDQEARILRLKAASQRKSREVDSMKQQANVSSELNTKLTEALLQSVRSKSSAEPEPGTSDGTDGAGNDGAGNNSGDDEPQIAGEPKTLYNLPEYQECIKRMNLEGLVMSNEADSMTRAIDVKPVEGTPLRYIVPMHLMGLIIGRNKITLNRIINQTSTEIEPMSWVENNERLMGFYILGSAAAIRSAINEMVAVVRNMDKTRAKKVIMSHLRPGGGKSSKLCIHFAKGHCTYGNSCRFTHKKNAKK